MFWSRKSQKNKNPAGPPAARHGTYCRTATFEQTPPQRDDTLPANGNVQKEYLEAYQQDGSPLWTVNRIRIENKNGKAFYQCLPQADNLPLPEALGALQKFESFQQGRYPGQNIAAEIADLGLRHHRAFAEREGTLWDKGAPQPPTADNTRIRMFMAASTAPPSFETALKSMFDPADRTFSQIYNDASGKNKPPGSFSSDRFSLAREFTTRIMELAFGSSSMNAYPQLSTDLRNPVTVPNKLWPRQSAHRTEIPGATKERYRRNAHGDCLETIDGANHILCLIEKNGEDVTPLRQMLFAFEVFINLNYVQSMTKYCAKNPDKAAAATPGMQLALQDALTIMENHTDRNTRPLCKALMSKFIDGKPLGPLHLINIYNPNRGGFQGTPKHC